MRTTPGDQFAGVGRGAAGGRHSSRRHGGAAGGGVRPAPCPRWAAQLQSMPSWIGWRISFEKPFVAAPKIKLTLPSAPRRPDLIPTRTPCWAPPTRRCTWPNGRAGEPRQKAGFAAPRAQDHSEGARCCRQRAPRRRGAAPTGASGPPRVDQSGRRIDSPSGEGRGRARNLPGDLPAGVPGVGVASSTRRGLSRQRRDPPPVGWRTRSTSRPRGLELVQRAVRKNRVTAVIGIMNERDPTAAAARIPPS